MYRQAPIQRYCLLPAVSAGKSRVSVKVTTVKEGQSSPYNRPCRNSGGAEVRLYSFINLGTRWEWVVNATPRSLTPGTYSIGNRVGLKAGKDGRRKSRLHRDSIPAPSNP